MNANSKEKLLIKNTLLYTVSNFGSKILSFLIVPLYTYYLTTAEYGLYDTVISIVNMMTPMCILAIHEGLLRWLLKSEENDNDIIGTGCALYIAFLVITDGVLLVLFYFWRWEYWTYFIILLTSSTLHIVTQFMARGAKKNKAFALSGVLYTIIMLLLNVILVIWIRCGIKGMLLSMAIAHIVATVYLLIVLNSFLLLKSLRFNKILAKEMLLYSIMLVPNQISWWVMNTSDRVMLTFMLGSSVTGIYSLVCKFPTIMSVFHSLFYQVWQEQAVIEYDSQSRDEYYSKIFNIYMKLSSCLILCLIPFSKLFILYFMNESYREGFVYVGILYLGTLFYSFSNFYGTGYISAKDTKNAMKSTGAGAVINAAINFMFIRTMGIWAACLSTLVGYLVVWLIRLRQTKKYFTITVDWKIFFCLLTVIIIYSIIVCFTTDLLSGALLLIGIIISWFINKSFLYEIVFSVILHRNRKQ